MDSFLVSVVEFALGVVLGGVLNWLLSRHYYKRAGDELRNEAIALHQGMSAVVGALRQDKDALVELQRDDAGRVTRVKVSAVVRMAGVGGFGAVGNVTVVTQP
jgi:hypothetical protein